MSNIGKSFWAKRIAARKRYMNINCDALIEKRLEAELAQGGYHDLSGIAKWMGFPSDPQYARNSALYLDCEKAVLRTSLEWLRNDPTKTVVIDTTGSVIYTGDELLKTLRETTRVIYFEASEAHIAALFKRYLAHPKPVLWGDSYRPEAGETPQETLARCYPELLRDRAARYKKIAHVTIPFDSHRNHQARLEDLIRENEVSV